MFHQDSLDISKKPGRCPHDKDRCDVIPECQFYQHDDEVCIGPDIYNSPTDKLTGRSQEKRCNGTSEIEAEYSELAESSVFFPDREH